MCIDSKQQVPSESKIIAQLCVALSGEHHRILKVDWQRAISEALAESEELLKGVSSRHLELAVEAMDVDRVMRRAKQRSIFGNSMALPQAFGGPLIHAQEGGALREPGLQSETRI